MESSDAQKIVDLTKYGAMNLIIVDAYQDLKEQTIYAEDVQEVPDLILFQEDVFIFVLQIRNL